MKLVINEKLIKRNKLIGTITTFSSLAVLALGLVFAFSKENPSYIILSYVALILGFILSQVGIYFTNRFGRTPRFDQIISSNFEKLTNDYTFYVYSTPIPMLLVGPTAIWIPMPTTATGKIYYEKGRWRQQGAGFMMKTFGQEGIGKPDLDADAYKKDITKHLLTKLGEDFNIPPLKPILVVMMKNGEIGEVSEATLPIVTVDKLKRYIRHEDRHETEAIPPETLEIVKNAVLK